MKQLYLSIIRFRKPRLLLRRLRGLLLRQCGHADSFEDMVGIARRLRCDLFIDIGCHHGLTSLRLLETGLRAPILAVDPFGENLSKARQSLGNYGQIQFVQAAVSANDGEARFFINQNEQTSSLLENAAGNIASFGVDTAHEQTITVPTLSLDSLINRYSPNARRIIVKSDTQGAEAQVIRGGLNTIRDRVCAFYAEFMLGHMYEHQASFEELRALLENQCGLVLRDIYPCLHDKSGVAVQADALWINHTALAGFE
jgi:FkbM family methyltransferase